MTDTVRIEAEVQLPSVPNFLRMGTGQTLDIADVPDASLWELGGQWATALVQRAAKRRAVRAVEVSS